MTGACHEPSAGRVVVLQPPHMPAASVPLHTSPCPGGRSILLSRARLRPKTREFAGWRIPTLDRRGRQRACERRGLPSRTRGSPTVRRPSACVCLPTVYDLFPGGWRSVTVVACNTSVGSCRE